MEEGLAGGRLAPGVGSADEGRWAGGPETGGGVKLGRPKRGPGGGVREREAAGILGWGSCEGEDAGGVARGASEESLGRERGMMDAVGGASSGGKEGGMDGGVEGKREGSGGGRDEGGEEASNKLPATFTPSCT